METFHLLRIIMIQINVDLKRLKKPSTSSRNIGINHGRLVDRMKFWRAKVHFRFGEAEVIWTFIELLFGM